MVTAYSLVLHADVEYVESVPGWAVVYTFLLLTFTIQTLLQQKKVESV